MFSLGCPVSVSRWARSRYASGRNTAPVSCPHSASTATRPASAIAASTDRTPLRTIRSRLVTASVGKRTPSAPLNAAAAVDRSTGS